MLERTIVRYGESYEVWNPKDATKQGFRPITHPYGPLEWSMMDNVSRDMKRGKVRFAIVREDNKEPNKLSIWRV